MGSRSSKTQSSKGKETTWMGMSGAFLKACAHPENRTSAISEPLSAFARASSPHIYSVTQRLLSDAQSSWLASELCLFLRSLFIYAAIRIVSLRAEVLQLFPISQPRRSSTRPPVGLLQKDVQPRPPVLAVFLPQD